MFPVMIRDKDGKCKVVEMTLWQYHIARFKCIPQEIKNLFTKKE